MNILGLISQLIGIKTLRLTVMMLHDVENATIEIRGSLDALAKTRCSTLL